MEGLIQYNIDVQSGAAVVSTVTSQHAGTGYKLFFVIFVCSLRACMGVLWVPWVLPIG